MAETDSRIKRKCSGFVQIDGGRPVLSSGGVGPRGRLGEWQQAESHSPALSHRSTAKATGAKLISIDGIVTAQAEPQPPREISNRAPVWVAGSPDGTGWLQQRLPPALAIGKATVQRQIQPAGFCRMQHDSFGRYRRPEPERADMALPSLQAVDFGRCANVTPVAD